MSASITVIAILARGAAPDIADLCDDALDDLWEQILDLPAIDNSLLVELLRGR